MWLRDEIADGVGEWGGERKTTYPTGECGTTCSSSDSEMLIISGGSEDIYVILTIFVLH